jgi:hypothetical protein
LRSNITVPANERSHADQPVPTARHRRRRLLTHGAVFAGAGILAITLAPSSTSAAPTVQDGRFLQGGSVSVNYVCQGNDQDTIDLLTSFQQTPFSMPVTITSGSVTPAPSPGEDFDVDFTWDFALDPGIVAFAVGLGTTSFNISNGVNPISATTGATGTAAGTGGGAHLVDLVDTVFDGFTDGPHTGTFNRTAAVDSPIVFTPGTITSTVVTSGNVTLTIICQPGAGAITVLDETGVAPSTTTTTRPAVSAPTTTATTVAVQAGQLPRTGTSSTLYLTLLALGLIDVGYLALTAARPARRRASSAR